mmetsp:Transcript_13677/g.53972  ORF Transcript_13677/g.53972 Transcript_13677/m.53972 type:complete len:318 (-) Transcript_13677:1658-2611(-)
MAEAVNFLIENEVSEAQLYERAAVFTTHEIQDIFKKRSRFEYLLRRRRVDASCYTNYIKFEQNLIELLRLREAHRGHGSALVRAVCHSFISKVVVLYRRALRETKGNVGLWLRFATFCHQHGNRRLLSRVITQALQMNPSCAGLWAFAAFWEYTSQGDVSAARRFFLRGLRNCSHGKVLWHEYFRLEVSHATSLAARCKLLGLTILDLPRAEQANGAAERVLNVASLRHPDDVVFQLYFVAIALGMSVRSYLTRLFFCLVYYQRDLTCSILLLRQESTSNVVNRVEETVASRIPDTGKWRNFHREKCLSRVNMNAGF